jgi:hypothetical protein
LQTGEQPAWAHTAEALPAVVLHQEPGCEQAQDPAFALTSFGNGSFFQLAYSDGTRFVLDAAATNIWAEIGRAQTTDEMALYLAGPIMGFALRRRGILALHASSVSVDNNSVILCGDSGLGKSTTAAALALRGIPVLADDISPIAQEDGRLYVQPGYPRVCLWPEAVEMMFGAPNALPRLTSTWEKCYLPLDGVRAAFEPKKHPLGLIYIFAQRVNEPDAPRVEELPMREALLQLVQNTYMNWLLDRNQRAAELDALAKLVASVPVRRVVPHADPARIGTLCEVIIEDAQRLLRRQSVPAAGSQL